MPSFIRYHLDESVTTVIAAGLRRAGIDVTTSQEVGLLTATDHEQLDYAMQHGRVLVTRDRDFLRLAKEGVHHAGIAYWHPGHRLVGMALAQLTLLWRCTTAEEMHGMVQFI